MHNSAAVSTPTRYGVLIAIMHEYGWSWRDLCEAPADLIEEIGTRLMAERHWRAERQRMDDRIAEGRRMLGH